MELACSSSKVHNFLGEGREDLRARFKEYALQRSFQIPKILIELGFPSGFWRINFSKLWDHMGGSLATYDDLNLDIEGERMKRIIFT